VNNSDAFLFHQTAKIDTILRKACWVETRMQFLHRSELVNTTGKFIFACLLVLPSFAHAKEWRQLDPSEVPSAVRKASGYRPGINLCWLNAFSIDTDPQGTNIRAAPDRNAPIITKIPGERDEAGNKIGPEFQVIGSVDGWLLIRQVTWAGYDLNEKLIFNGLGWIAAGLVSFSAEDPWLRSAPRADASRVRGFSPDENAAPGLEVNDAIIKRVHHCSGSFVDVDLEAPDGRKARGWVTGARAIKSLRVAAEVIM
jgi:hypothetical protein